MDIVQPQEAPNVEPKPICGIIMPISAIDGYPERHWENVLLLLEEVITDAGFHPNLVSRADEVNIIQNTIVNNIYNNDIVVCDVSSRNPNVAFELGMRLTFDKPTVIIKDDITAYPFDISIIEYLQYRQDLRYHDTLKFKEVLAKKIKDTYEEKKRNADYSPFLGHFKQLTVPKLDQKEVNINDFIVKAMTQMQDDVSALKDQINPPRSNKPLGEVSNIRIKTTGTIKRKYEYENYIRQYIKLNQNNYSNVKGLPLVEMILKDIHFLNGIDYTPRSEAMDIIANVLASENML